MKFRRFKNVPIAPKINNKSPVHKKKLKLILQTAGFEPARSFKSTAFEAVASTVPPHSR